MKKILLVFSLCVLTDCKTHKEIEKSKTVHQSDATIVSEKNSNTKEFSFDSLFTNNKTLSLDRTVTTYNYAYGDAASAETESVVIPGKWYKAGESGGVTTFCTPGDTSCRVVVDSAAGTVKTFKNGAHTKTFKNVKSVTPGRRLLSKTVTNEHLRINDSTTAKVGTKSTAEQARDKFNATTKNLDKQSDEKKKVDRNLAPWWLWVVIGAIALLVYVVYKKIKNKISI